MGYLNPLLQLPAAQELMKLPSGLRGLIERLFREIRAHANTEAETSWKRRKAPMALYWRWVATICRHIANALSKGSSGGSSAYELIEWHDAAQELPDADTTVMIIIGGEVEAWPGYLDGNQWRTADGMPVENVLSWAHMLEGPQS